MAPKGSIRSCVRVCASALAVALAGPTAAQVTAPPPSDPPAPIVVTARRPLAPDEKPSAWRRAESDHLIVYSDGGESQLRQTATDLERLHALLTRLYKGRGRDDNPGRLTVVLFGSADALRDRGLRSPRFDDGPYARAFSAQRYYDPRPGGGVLALARVDEIATMNTSKARDADCQDLAAAGADCSGLSTYQPPTSRTWQALLYGAYAQHIVLTYAPVPYPRWYVDGVGALFATTEFKRDGSVEYGRPPAASYRAVFRSYGPLDTARVLSGDYLRTPSQTMRWTPYHAGLLTHYFVLSKLPNEERRRFAAYMAAIGRGVPMADAVRAFGPLARLRRDVMNYTERDKDYAVTAKGGAVPTITLTPISVPAADAMLASLAPQP